MDKIDFYIASPYTHDDPTVRDNRAKAAAYVTGHLMQELPGFVFYSPIVHGHAVASVYPGLPVDYSYWRNQCLRKLALSQSMLIIPLPGYELSTGVNDEVNECEKVGRVYDYLQEDIMIVLLQEAGLWDAVQLT